MVARRTQLKAQQGMAQFCTIPWIGDSNEMQEEKNIEMIVYRLVKKDEYQYQIKKDQVRAQSELLCLAFDHDGKVERLRKASFDLCHMTGRMTTIPLAPLPFIT